MFFLMPIYGRHFESGQLQFITTSTYRRVRLFDSPRFRWAFIEALRQLRRETGFLLIGWVLMPEHFHLLIKPEPAKSTSRWVQELKKRTAQAIIATLKQNALDLWCQSMLDRLRLPASVHSDSRYRIWQRRFVPFNVYSEKSGWRNSTTCTSTR